MATAAAEGGAGGKFRKKPFRRSAATPYDRPPTSLRAAGGNGGWISKLVDPASKLITSGAHRLFASVFRKRLPAPPPANPSPPPPQDSYQAQRTNLQDAVPVDPPGSHKENTVEDSYLDNSSGGCGIAELEQILKQKTFTGAQIDRLTKLLHARTLDVSPGNAEKRSESNILEVITEHDRSADAPIKDNGIESERLLGVTSTPVISSKAFKEEVASPAELAKAYMVGRPSKVSPSMLGLRSQVFKEDVPLPSGPNNPAFPPKLSMKSPAPRSSLRSGLPDNGFMTPRSRGRSTIYRMARTPYSRAEPMGALSTIDGYGGPSSSSSQSMWEQNGPSESIQVGLKRRSSVLDDEIGSFGPVRRTRQKSILVSGKRSSLSISDAPVSTRGTATSSDDVRFALPSARGPLLLNESEHKISKMLRDNGNNGIPGASFTSVPSQSSETAAKILQHLNHLVDTSPLKKSPEVKLADARETSPGKLTTNMLHGRALRSLENVDTSKCLQIVEDNTKLDSSSNGCLPGGLNSVSQKQGKVDENGAVKFVSPCERVAPPDVPIVDSAATRTSNSVFSIAGSNSSQKKQAFQMSAPEDHLDLDDDDYTNEDVSAVVAEGNGKLDTSVGSEAFAAEAVRVGKSPGSSEAKTPTNSVGVEKTPESSEAKNPTNSVMDKKTDLRMPDASVLAERNTSFTFPSPTTPSMTVHSLVSQTTSAINPAVTPKEPSAGLPLFYFNSGNVNNTPAKVSNSSSSASESPKSMFASTSNLKPQSSSSFASIAAESVQRIPESHKDGSNNVQKDDELISKPNNVTLFVPASSTFPSPAESLSTSSTSSFSFSFGASKSSTENGALSTSSVFSSPAPASALGVNSSNNQLLSSSPYAASTASTIAVISTTASTATTSGIDASSSSISSTSVAPSFSSASVFKFGSSAAPLTTVSPALVTSGGETANPAAQKTQEKSFGSQPASSSGTSAGSSCVFGFTAQSSPSGTGTAVSSQSTPVQFGSSAPSPIFGSSSFASGNSLFGSSSSATNMFSSDSNGSKSGTTPSTFGSKSLLFGSTSNSTSPSTGFAFGSSSGSAPSKSVPSMFGLSTDASSGSTFSFTSAAAATPSQSVFGNSNLPVFAFGSAATGNNDQMNMEDSMAEDNGQASTAAVPAFSQPPVSPPGYMFGATTPSGSFPSFQFGGQQNPTTPNTNPFQNSTVPQNPNPFQNQAAPPNRNPFQNQPTPPNLNPFQNQTASPNSNPFQNQTTPNPNLLQSSGSLDFSAGGSFSLGSGSTNKSNRRMIKVKRRK